MFGVDINGKAQRCFMFFAVLMFLSILLCVAFEGHIDTTIMFLVPKKAAVFTAINRYDFVFPFIFYSKITHHSLLLCCKKKNHICIARYVIKTSERPTNGRTQRRLTIHGWKNMAFKHMDKIIVYSLFTVVYSYYVVIISPGKFPDLVIRRVWIPIT